MTATDYKKMGSPGRDGAEESSSGCSKGTLGLLAMIFSSFLFSLMALLVKFLPEFGTFEVVFWRSVFMFIGCMGWLGVKRINPAGPPGNQIILITRGVAGFGFMGGFYFALQKLQLSDAVVITYTSPVLTAIAAALLLGEPWGALDAAGSLLSLGGVVLISKPPFIMKYFGVQAAPLPLIGTLGAIAAALSSTGTYLLLRFARHLDPMVSTNYFAMVGIVLSPLLGWIHEEAWHLPQGEEWAKLILLALLSIVGQAFMNIGLSMQTAAKATAMLYVQVVFAFIFQTTLLHEATDAQKMVGACMIASWGGIALTKEALGKRPVVKAREVDENLLKTEPEIYN